MTEYENALAAANAASATFAKVAADYRAMKIGDAEFLAARAVYDAANAAFDVAFAAARDAGEDAENFVD